MKKIYTAAMALMSLVLGINAQTTSEPLAVQADPMPLAGGGPNCIVGNASGTLTSGFPQWDVMGSMFVWFDISGSPGCGMSYPFDLAQVDVNIADPFAFTQVAGSGTGTLTYQVNIYDAATPGDECTGPGNMIASSGNISSVYADEVARVESIPFTETLNNGFFVEWAFVSWTGPGPEVPTVLWDDQPRPLCHQFLTFDDGLNYIDHTDVFTTDSDIGWVDMAIQGTGNSGGGPANDDCSGAVAQNLNAGGSVVYNGDNTGATDDGQGLETPQVWEAFTTTECLDITIEYCGTPSVFENGFISIFDGCPFADFVQASAWDQTNCVDGNWTMSYYGVPAGTWYYPVMSEPGSVGAYTLTVSGVPCAGPPANDDCAGAVPLTPNANCVPTAGTTAAATESLPAIECNGYQSSVAIDVWYSFVATATSNTIEATGVGIFDGILELFEGTCAGLSSLDCADATLGGGTETIAATGLTIGNTYYVRIYSWEGGGSDFEICVTGGGGGGTPPNDDCSNAVVQNLNVGGSIQFTGDNTGATDIAGLGTPSVWEAFTLTECADITLDYCGTTPAFENFWLALVDACPFNGGFIAPTDNEDVTCGDGNSTLTFIGVQPGTWYYPVLSEPGSVGPYVINVSAAPCAAPPANDECAGAIDLAPSNVCMPTAMSVVGATESMPPLECNTYTSTVANDVWFSFEATNTDLEIQATGIGNYDAIIEMFEGTCAGLVSIDCADATLAAETESIMATGLTIGNTYYFRVYAWAGIGTDLEVCVIDLLSTGIGESTTSGISIFPNPAKDQLVVRYDGDAQQVQIDLMDVSGKLVLSQNNILGGDLILDISSVTPGIYMLNLHNQDGLESRHRLIVE